MANTACELGLMGRKIIWNGNSPNAINYKNSDSIVEIVKNEYLNRKSNDYIMIAQRMKDFLNVGDSFLYL